MNKNSVNKSLRSICFSGPTLPNGGSRFGITVSQALVDGKRSRKAPYTVNVFDRASPWIKPNHTKGFTGTLEAAMIRAIAHLDTAILLTLPHQSAVNAAMVTVQPFDAREMN